MMLSLLRRTWKVWAQTLWLWCIDVEVNRCMKHKQRLKRRQYAVRKLTEGFNETFSENLLSKETVV